MRSSLGTFRGRPTTTPLGTGLAMRSDKGTGWGLDSPRAEERLWVEDKKKTMTDTRGF